MKRFNDVTYRADKLSNSGVIEYSLWIDKFGELYIQLMRNDFKTESPGTFSDCFFSINANSNKKLSRDNICGVDVNLNKKVIGNVNTSFFLQAAINHHNDVFAQ
ncbi:hypothetical protein C9J22_13150 [Photobacterium phosphoreum]|uniref:hypothetical protein n=1 Tax=Photobacterium phosphoreum TaxID=659 RepID=UPI000D152AB7|nr:hypothetical protein [Photobacterium phosphoreum]PSU69819.1 hypothetical protein C9J22_13150 [Photobacterium phosphoreum]